MPIAIKMPALSPTMEEGTLARWLIEPGQTVAAGDVMAEIETDKATMEFEAVDEGVVASLLVPAGTEGVKVGTVIAVLAAEGEDPAEAERALTAEASGTQPAEGAPTDAADRGGGLPRAAEPTGDAATAVSPPASPASSAQRSRIIASPLARRIAEQQGVDLAQVKGTGPGGRIVKADVEAAQGDAAVTPAPAQPATPPPPEPATARSPAAAPDADARGGEAPFETVKLNNVRKVIARRLTEAKQTIPHIYLTVDVRLDALLDLRAQLNASLEADGVKLSVNDLLIKALARALARVPACNVSFQGDALHRYSRQDISVAVAAPSGLITPIIVDAGRKGLAQISTEMKELAARAKDGKLQPHEYQGGTASLSNLGMFGTKQFDAVINPPQAMILAVGAGEQRPWVIDGALGVATVMSVTGSFDHRAIDGADGAQLLQAFRQLVEQPMGLVV
ncbi:pyruvate dehydrogenase complex dihydrolipoamide acetyltransferase [Erythrobacteraceae bacterium CFH 75059]|uniref:pyruvate dehydrogenase complex dihydrolipoamide acetyltransferase n=1 Tax=Qipengyuania thermophila TaxID=2509361 RepID=UPI00101F4C41|nr:pyruvate dehydrogenase complex dihydrolipoamide acetyltransferase [Qipengyuania thermophila]TCD05197.1 pyruvate dehydrogenase complex dihydrolipoamide acetyltransferase [Erythrobacteraceae bacterium CFH 75059]